MNKRSIAQTSTISPKKNNIITSSESDSSDSEIWSATSSYSDSTSSEEDTKNNRAAIDFLSNIPLQSKKKPKQQSKQKLVKKPILKDNKRTALGSSSPTTSSVSLKKTQSRETTDTNKKLKFDRSDSAATDFLKGISLSGTDVKKPGKEGKQTSVKIDEHSKRSHLNREKKNRRRSIKDNANSRTILKSVGKRPDGTRLIFSRSKGGPMMVYSMINHETRSRKMSFAIDPIASSTKSEQSTGATSDDYHIKSKKSISYGQHLVSSWVSIDDEPDGDAKDNKQENDNDRDHDDQYNQDQQLQLQSQDPSELSYDPDFLDDPDLKTGKHRTVLNLPGFRGSILPFVKPEDLKEEINEQFRLRHITWFDPQETGLTLYKIRKFKRKLLDMALEKDIEPSTVALAYVFLEKLLMKKNIVTKDNLSLIGSVCFFLAVKFNDTKLEPVRGRMIQELIEEHTGVSPKELRENEFDVFAKLSFSLFVDPKEVLPHYARLLNQIESTSLNS